MVERGLEPDFPAAVRAQPAGLGGPGRDADPLRYPDLSLLVTGQSEGNTWVRLLTPPVAGKLWTDGAALDVGTRVDVRLVSTDMERGFIDFALLR